MRKYWLLASDRFNALTARERYVSFVSLVAVLCMLAYLLFIGPMLDKRLRYQQQIKQNSLTLQSLQGEEQTMLQLSLQDPDAARHQQIQELDRQNQMARIELADFQTRLAAPDKMPRLLEDLLRRENGLELLSVKTLAPENLFVADASATTDSQAMISAVGRGVYRHGLEVTVRGNYAQLAAYARRIEQLPWRLYWGDLSLQVERYPLSQMSFTVYTISMDPSWLSL